MDENKYFVKHKWMNFDSDEIAKKKQSAKLKHAQKAEKALQEKEFANKAFKSNVNLNWQNTTNCVKC